MYNESVIFLCSNITFSTVKRKYSKFECPFLWQAEMQSPIDKIKTKIH